jgi:hypothetical protein
MPASSFFAAEKNGNVFVLRASMPWSIRPAHLPGSGPVGRRLAYLFAI